MQTTDSQVPNAAPTAGELNAQLRLFSEHLSRVVGGPPIQLPSYPVVALQAQRILMDPNAGLERLLGVISSEPVFAAKIVSMANSAALSRPGQRVASLRAAVSRLGFDALRTAAVSFALSQLRNAAAYRGIAQPVKELCETGVEVGVLGFVLARHTRAALPDTALLAGLVSGMGKLYILTRAEEFPVLFANSWTRRELFQSWHAQLAGHVLENWQMPPEIIDAVAGMDRAGTETREAPKLADVLACAQLIREMQQRPDELALALIASQAAQRLLLTPEVCDGLLEESLSERAQLASALTY